MLDSGYYINPSSSGNITFSSLTSGDDYQVQLWTPYWNNNFPTTFSDGSHTVNMGNSQSTSTYVSGSFNASSGNESVYYSGTSGNYGLFGATQLRDVSGYWTGAASSNWGNSGNGSTDLNFAGNGTVGRSFTDVSSRFNYVNFGDGAATTSVTVASGGVSVGNVYFRNNTSTYTIADASGTTGITGNTAVTLLGTGTVIFSGGNSYTGNTIISSGTLEFGVTAAMPSTGNVTASSGGVLAVAVGGTGQYTNGTSGAGTLGGIFAGVGTGSTTITLNSGSSVGIDTGSGNVTYSGNISTANSNVGLTKLGLNTLTLTGVDSYTGTTTINGGTLEFGVTAAMPSTGNVTANSGGVLAVAVGGTGQYTNGTSGAGTLGGIFAGVGTGSATITLNSGSSVGIDTGSGNVTYSGNISTANSNVGLTKIGLNTLTLTGVNSYTGTTTINGGTLQLGNGTTDGSIAGASIVDNANLTYNTASTNYQYAGVISGNGSVTKTGYGTFTLTGANSYTGLTTISAGTLIVGSSSSLGNGSATTVNASSTLIVASTVGTRTLSNVLTLNGGTLGVGLDNAGLGGTVTISGGNVTHTFTSTGNSTLTLPAPVTGASELVVGGGGGGGTTDLATSYGGGGGGGAVLNLTGNLSSGNTPIIVGAGGAGSSIQSTPGGNGTMSQIGSQQAAAGGKGGLAVANPTTSTISGGASGSGNAGGSGGGGGISFVGGGGGGASAVGGNATGTATSGIGGNGGNGTIGLITGIAYGGGGGGGANAHFFPLSIAGTGGSGGGGNGGNNGTYASSGGNNTGGGGGGGGGDANNSVQPSGAGGSGIVIIQYGGYSPPVAGAGTINLSGNVTDTATSTLDAFGSGGSITASGVISGVGGLNIASSNNAGGVVTFNASSVNTYQGATTVQSGATLALSGTFTNNIGNSSAITVSSGGTLNVTGLTGGRIVLASGQKLGGSGTVTGNTTVASGSTISAGTSVALGTGSSTANGLLSTGQEMWSGGGAYSWKITGLGTGGVTAGTGNSGNMGVSGTGSGVEGTNWDLLKASSMDLSNAGVSNSFTLAPVGAFSGSAGVQYSWVIAQSTGGNNTITLPSGISNGNNLLTTTPTSGAATAFVLNTSNFSYDGAAPSSSAFSLEAVNIGGHDDLVLDFNSTPEPGTTMLIAAGASSLLVRRRRRPIGRRV